MNHSKFEEFSSVSVKLCNILPDKSHNAGIINSLIDELNAKLYKTQLCVRINDAANLLKIICLYIKPAEEALAAKASHLMTNIVTKQIIPLSNEYLLQVVSWHLDCIKTGPDLILPDILHNMQCILHSHVHIGQKFINELIGQKGLLFQYIDVENRIYLTSQNSLQISLLVLKCIICLLPIIDEKNECEITMDIKQNISLIIIKYLMNGFVKNEDEFLYCKVVISALRVLSHVYFNYQGEDIPLPELMGISQYFILYGLIQQNSRPEKIMPAQQTIAATPVKSVGVRGGKKQKVRKHRNNAIEGLKKEIPVSDKSLLKDIDNFENSSAYKPASKNYLDSQKARPCWTLTSDSDMSDVENSREAKLVALKSRVRQSASNLFLVLFKIKDKREMFGYWFALLPNSPYDNNWLGEESSKRSLAYSVVTDPVASSRASTLSVILALLSGSKIYLGQAEVSKKSNSSFIPFSVSLGYLVVRMHKILACILKCERSQVVSLVALKCCAALVQATPYHKMQDGLIAELVSCTRKFLVHKEVTLQVGALITMGCILSIDPKIDEVLKVIQKDVRPRPVSSDKENKASNECDDFEEGYSDDELLSEEELQKDVDEEFVTRETYFDIWILDICFKNLGWEFRGLDKISCSPSPIPVVLESLQVLSAMAFHHLPLLLKPRIDFVTDTLHELLQHEHQDVVFQTARLVSIIGDSLQKLEYTRVDELPPLARRVSMWEKLSSPLCSVLQAHHSSAAKVVACDCIANIGEQCFKELPRRTRLVCCALLVGSCSDEEPSVRAAAVRALAMAVMYRTLREDVCFVSDCGENILRALTETALVVRTKAAWALANLSDALVLNMDDPELERIDDDLLLRLLEVSVQCADDNDKVKMNATRALGNMLRLIREDNLSKRSQMKPLCEVAISKLVECASKVSNMKVRWNACYAIGNAMKNNTLFTSFSGWQSQVFSNLCSLSQECKNLKVRINAAVALRAPQTRAHFDVHFCLVWRGVMEAMQNAANVDDFSEYKHKDHLIEQLCVTLAHACCLLQQTDLADILDPLIFNFECAKSLYAQLYQKLAPENVSCMKILQAAKYVTVDLTAANDTQLQSLGMLQEIFIWDM
ncbi:HEAT repeat-containing protein 6 isoform X2 [Pieris napi]|uniref:HEAT repeat-containing protein 6 isoform X2 n=1 Tax=Pieris napi TaxID=78633 RepID=UPI001FB88AF4|nr:HEAT repeat-containing protein 6 isoform X2 [Pieris napi]